MRFEKRAQFMMEAETMRIEVSILTSCWIYLLVPLLMLFEQGIASDPVVPKQKSDTRWVRLFADQKRQLRKKVDLCFIGDSLTEFWNETGKPILDLEFPNLKIANLGIAADRTEHILFRVEQFDFSRAKPEFIVLMAGTNNLAKASPDSPEETAGGIEAIVQMLQNKSPHSRIILLSILPNGYDPASALRQDILKTNRLLTKIPKVKYLDVHDLFIGESGKWKPGLTLDGTHLSLQGYDVLAQKISVQVKGEK